MVLPLWYEEMRRARAEEVPRAFHKVFGQAGLLHVFRLAEVSPPPRPESFVGPIQRPSFEIWREGSNSGPAAVLSPDGPS